MINKLSLYDVQNLFWESLIGQSDKFESMVNPIAELESSDCLSIYQRAYEARLIETLGETFEATWWVLGDELFFKLAKDYVLSFPSQNFDLSDYGGSFRKYLEERQELDQIPFIGSLAKFEWAFKEVFHKGNITPNPEAIIYVLSEDRPCQFKLHPSARLLDLKHSVYEIWKQRGLPVDVDSLPVIEWNFPQDIVLYKMNDSVHIMTFLPVEMELVTGILEGQTLMEVIEKLQKQSFPLNENLISDLFIKLGNSGILVPDLTKTY